MTDKYTQEDLEIINSAFGRETDHCIRGGDREAAVRQLYKRLRDIMTQADLS
jgi:hypothetical protein